MSPVNDEELATLLTETFASRESLVDPDRAVALATSARSHRRPGQRLPFAAAVVALVVAGTTYALAQGGGVPEASPEVGPMSPPTSLTGAAVTRANRVYAERIADTAMKRMRGQARRLPGSATEVGAEKVPALAHLREFIGTGVGQSFTRSAFFLAPGGARQVALWFDAHPPVGAASEGEPGAVGGSRNGDGSWTYEADYGYHLGQHGVDRATLASSVQVTRQGRGVGIRLTVFGEWRPGRPRASFATAVRSVSIRVTDRGLGGTRDSNVVHTKTLTGPAQLESLVTHFDALPGGVWSVSCPAMLSTRSYQIRFDTASGSVLARGTSECGSPIQVLRDGRDVPPEVDGTTFFPFVDRLMSLPPLQ